jgi:hypothetical protein
MSGEEPEIHALARVLAERLDSMARGLVLSINTYRLLEMLRYTGETRFEVVDKIVRTPRLRVKLTSLVVDELGRKGWILVGVQRRKPSSTKKRKKLILTRIAFSSSSPDEPGSHHPPETRPDG